MQGYLFAFSSYQFYQNFSLCITSCLYSWHRHLGDPLALNSVIMWNHVIIYKPNAYIWLKKINQIKPNKIHDLNRQKIYIYLRDQIDQKQSFRFQYLWSCLRHIAKHFRGNIRENYEKIIVREYSKQNKTTEKHM